MTKKDELFSKLQEFKAFVENQTGKKIKVLQSDNGGEYTLNVFKEFCAKVGMRRELTTPYNPPKNGVVERKNRTIVGAVEAMLHDQGIRGIPKFLWVEACNTTVFMQNRSPHSVGASYTSGGLYRQEIKHVTFPNILQFGTVMYQ